MLRIDMDSMRAEKVDCTCDCQMVHDLDLTLFPRDKVPVHCVEQSSSIRRVDVFFGFLAVSVRIWFRAQCLVKNFNGKQRVTAHVLNPKTLVVNQSLVGVR